MASVIDLDARRCFLHHGSSALLPTVSPVRAAEARAACAHSPMTALAAAPAARLGTDDLRWRENDMRQPLPARAENVATQELSNGLAGDLMHFRQTPKKRRGSDSALFGSRRPRKARSRRAGR